MLTSLLAATALGLVLQTGETAAPEARTVTENDAKAIAFIEESEALVHHPEDNGLESLSFDYVMAVPNIGNVGSVSVSWKKGDEDGNVTATPDESVLPNLAMMGLNGEALTAMMVDSGKEMLALQRGLMKAQILEQAYVTMDGVEDGMVQMRCHPRGDSELALVNDMVVLFDPDGLMKEMRVAFEQQGMSIRAVEKFIWKPAANGSYVLEARVAETDLPNPLGGGSMTMTQTTSHEHITVGELMLVSSFSVKMEAPMPGMGMDQKTEFTNILVNGEMVGG